MADILHDFPIKAEIERVFEAGISSTASQSLMKIGWMCELLTKSRHAASPLPLLATIKQVSERTLGEWRRSNEESVSFNSRNRNAEFVLRS